MKKQRITDRLTFQQTDYAGKVAGLYIRVSQDASVVKAGGKIDDRESLKAQKEGCIDYAKRHGWQYEIYEGDSDISGFEDIADRPSLKKLIADIESGKIHTVICRELKRIFRNETIQGEFISKVLKPNGVNLKAYGEEVDITTPEGMMIVGIKANRNQEELRYIATRSMASKASLAASGELIGKPSLGYGIRVIDKVREVYIKEAEAAIVKRIFQLFLKNNSARQIARILNAEGLKSQMQKAFKISIIQRVIANHNYIGEIKHDGKYYPAPYPIIIDRKTFQDAQDIAKLASVDAMSHRRKGAKPKHLLSGLLLCGYCADKGLNPHRLSIFTNHGKRSYTLYGCSNKRNSGNWKICPDSTSIRRETIEAFVENIILEKITLEDISKIAAMEVKPSSVDLQKQLAELNKKITRIQANRAKLLSDIAKGETDYNAELIRPMERNIADLQKQIDGIEAELRDATLDNAGKALSLRDQWQSMELASRKRMIADIIHSIKLYRDYLTIRYTVAPHTDFLYPVKRIGMGGQRVPQYVSFDSLLTKPEGLLIKVEQNSEAMLTALVDDMWAGKAPKSIPTIKDAD